VVFGVACLVALTVMVLARNTRRPAATGMEHLVGQLGVVRRPITPAHPGKVFVFGEYWNAVSDHALDEGQNIVVVGYDRMTLRVAPVHME